MNLSKWFKGLRGRLTAIMAIATFTIITLNIVTLMGEKNIETNIKAITEIRMPSIKGLEAMNEGQTAMLQAIDNIEANLNNFAEVKKNLEIYNAKKQQVLEGYKLYEPLPQTPDETEEWNNVFLKVWPAWEKACNDYIESVSSNNRIGLNSKLELIKNTTKPAAESLDKIVEINYKNAGNDRKAAEETANQMRYMNIVLGSVGTMLVILISVLVAVKTTSQLSKLTTQLSDASQQVAAASAQIASASVELSQSTTEQASSLEETAASLEEISAMIAKSSENADSTAKTSQVSYQKAEEGRHAVTQMMESMQEISQSNTDIMNQITDSNAQMTEIVNLIREIGNKTKVINEIVFQTKLLSFNASVEAARAGEHGKGFAVVAQEVGNLAQMSGDAAKDISDMLGTSISKVEKIVEETKVKVGELADTSKNKVQNGLEVATLCNDALTEIVQNVSSMTTLAQEISHAGKEQTQGVGEINKAMSQLDTVTQQNSSTSDEAASAAEQLSAQAASLNQAVEELVHTVEGDNATGSTNNTQKKYSKNNVVEFKKKTQSHGSAQVIHKKLGVPSGQHKAFSEG